MGSSGSKACLKTPPHTRKKGKVCLFSLSLLFSLSFFLAPFALFLLFLFCASVGGLFGLYLSLSLSISLYLSLSLSISLSIYLSVPLQLTDWIHDYKVCVHHAMCQIETVMK